jgi:ATP-dependent exoDNAse (exonuclease V) beta subunit
MMPSIESSATVTKYLADLEHNFPNQLFQSTEHRSSKFPAEIRPQVTRKENHATRMAALALPTAFNNRRRHETLLRFMLINDSATVAVKIPVFLTKGDVEYYRTQGFNLGFESAVITGHIDFLQIRNGHLHILDYKPEARKETHAHVQLTIYALALARRAGLPLKVFKCEHDRILGNILTRITQQHFPNGLAHRYLLVDIANSRRGGVGNSEGNRTRDATINDPRS